MRTALADQYDVIILGSGLSGSVLGVIMARKGWKVLILDGAVHPKFAIGESTIPQTSLMFSLLAQEHDIPELHAFGLGGPRAIRERVGATSGVKRTFGFCYHRPGQPYNAAEANQFGNVWRDENHLFRQDVDAYLFHLAMHDGCDTRQGVRVESVHIDDAGVQVKTTQGDVIAGRFIVDGTGIGSVLARQLGLREEPTRLRTRSRSLCNHFLDVKPFEDCVDNLHSNPWSMGTLHHVFHGGWFWIIPFNNWEGSTNPLVSVGLTLDTNVYPLDPSKTPQQEFAEFVQRLPAVATQFENAKAVRPWIAIPSLQYSSTRTTGARYCLMSHAAGFVDALFSRGLISTLEVIRALVKPLHDCLSGNEFADSDFEDVERVQERSFYFADRLVEASYVAFRDYAVWDAWLRPWAIGLHSLESILASRIMMGEFSRFRLVDDPISSPFEPPGYRAFFEDAFSIMARYRTGETDSASTAEQLWSLSRNYEFEIPLPSPELRGHEWAITSPGVRDIFMGSPAKHERWAQHLPDPFIAPSAASGTAG